MIEVEYITVPDHDLDLVAPLWLKLQQHHSERSSHFADHLHRVGWPQRREGLRKKASDGKLRIDVVRDVQADQRVGYCITSLSADGKGEIESIYVEPEYRRQSIGDCLMRRALQWLDEGGAKVRSVGVGVGNEEVFGFYRRYGFVPRTTIFQQRPELGG